MEDASAEGGGHGAFTRANGMPAFAGLAFQRVKVCVEVFFDSVCVRRARPLIPRWRRCKCISGILLACCVMCGSSRAFAAGQRSSGSSSAGLSWDKRPCASHFADLLQSQSRL